LAAQRFQIWSHHRFALVPMNPGCCAREARSGSGMGYGLD
jgi:hypothetical protein